ncbi:MAG: hypothetical protein WC740_09480 [Verrucomicrobiia bacterium]
MMWIAPFEKDAATDAPSFRLICKLHLRIQDLPRTRDLPLPRLLSGHVNLEEN